MAPYEVLNTKVLAALGLRDGTTHLEVSTPRAANSSSARSPGARRAASSRPSSSGMFRFLEANGLGRVPLLLSIPMHFLLELPEHVLCDNDSTDVLRNTRTISGSRFSQWFTNGNNFHVEHHAAMVVPINRLSERHALAKEWATHTEESYVTFYRKVLREASRNSRSRA
ncbi:hypothetical protein GCM10022384_13150 [Streptomyces marokkonensis]|uniref:Fatty acid desaturase domain-containing protein n=1 Tax=Streptomyces marokkonensis TaxID=324855 RepID=A0ABP7PA76_9ACTN